ncbi:MAG: hypothetical protein R2810_09300 [Flavobacteriales bacterium]
MVNTTDLYATLVEAMGGQLLHYQDSYNFWRCCAHEKPCGRHDFLFSERGRTDVPGGQFGWAMQVGRYKYIALTNGQRMLFDANRDPGVEHDLLSKALILSPFLRDHGRLRAPLRATTGSTLLSGSRPYPASTALA